MALRTNGYTREWYMQQLTKYKGMEAFIFELGTRANKVEILRKEDNSSIEVKPKGWLGRWNDEPSSGKDSCWIKIKTTSHWHYWSSHTGDGFNAIFSYGIDHMYSNNLDNR